MHKTLSAAMIAAALFTVPVAANDDLIDEAQARAPHYDRKGLVAAASRLFGDASSGIAEAIEDAVDKHGTPNGYIVGEEVGAAFIGGVRYGRGALTTRLADGGEQTIPLYWQGASAGYDFGASASKSFFLVYDLESVEKIYQRFPGVDGHLYVGAGAGITYSHANGVTLVPVRTGLGLRGGGNVGYVHFTSEKSWLPF